MTQKTTYRRAKSKFDKSKVSTRIKKRFKRKYKKSISRSKVWSVWRDWVDIMIIEPLIEKGKVQIDNKCSIEIVGRRLVEDKKKMNLYTRGLMLKRGKGIVELEKLNQHRKGFTYRIVMHEQRFKEGMLIFEADPKIRKLVTESLKNTNRYYRIEYNGN